METIKELDMQWFWYGYGHGVSMRKKIKTSPDRITRLGILGTIKIPTEKQKASYFLGLQYGRGKIVNNLNLITVASLVGKKRLYTKDHNTIGLWGSAYSDAQPGQIVSIPFFTRGIKAEKPLAGFRAVLSYDTKVLVYVSNTKNESWDGTYDVILNDTENGVLIIEGFRSSNLTEDMSLFEVSFQIREDIPPTRKQILMDTSYRTPSMSEHSRLYAIEDSEYKILSPWLSIPAAIYMEIPEVPPISSITYAQPDKITIGTGPTVVKYMFNATVARPWNSTVKGGVYAKISVFLDSKEIGYKTVPLQIGTHTYQGEIPIYLEKLTTGKLSYVVTVYPDYIEDKNTYSVFIGAGSIYTIETEVKREEVAEIELEVFNRLAVEKFRIADSVYITKHKEQGGPVDVIVIENIGKITDIYTDIVNGKVKDTETIDNIGMSDTVFIMIRKA